jgi:hypothetical protein
LQFTFPVLLLNMTEHGDEAVILRGRINGYWRSAFEMPIRESDNASVIG